MGTVPTTKEKKIDQANRFAQQKQTNKHVYSKVKLNGSSE